MNYIELINRYWQEVDIKGWTPVETEIYFRLLDYCNRTGWTNPFILPNPRAVALMAVTENTLAAGRDKLVMKGLIGFRKGSRRKDAPMYCFPEKIGNEWVFPDDFTSSFTSIFEAKTGAKTGAKRGVKTGAKQGAYNKTKTKTDISPDGDSAIAPPHQAEISLFAQEEKQTSKRKPKASKDPPPTPSLEEVMQYFQIQDADKRLRNWKESARRFYDNFNAVGWRDKFNRRIINWDSRANSWILDDERQQRETRTVNEAKQSDKFSERRGTEPNSANRKGFKGTF